MARKKRNYKKEYADYHSTPEQKKKRAMRNQARRIMKKKLGAKAIKGKDIDHKKPLRFGGTNAPSNLRVTSRSVNRAWRKKKK